MVLLDGQTFAEIAKTLRFRNRKENLVDSISVEMIIRDNLMEIFPFTMQMDRYRVAIGGKHNLDMTYNYHVSVLQSPLPFTMGINIAGDLNTDKMKIGIGRARYRDSNMPIHVTVIDATRLDLRTQINSFIQQGVDVARFNRFAAPPVDSTLIANDVLTAQDSLALYKEGIIDVAPISLRDTTATERRRRNRVLSESE